MSKADHTPTTDSDRSFLESLGWPSPRLIDSTLAALTFDGLPEDAVERQRWLLYTLLQLTADSNRLNELAWANDERAEVYLKAIDEGTLPPDVAELANWLKNLSGNRAQKHARRQRLLQAHKHELKRPGEPNPVTTAERNDELARVKRLTTEWEWSLLRGAENDGLRTVAEAEGVLLGTLKSQLSRCRARLRQVC
jgi:hypothetical protein